MAPGLEYLNAEAMHIGALNGSVCGLDAKDDAKEPKDVSDELEHVQDGINKNGIASIVRHHEHVLGELQRPP